MEIRRQQDDVCIQRPFGNEGGVCGDNTLSTLALRLKVSAPTTDDSSTGYLEVGGCRECVVRGLGRDVHATSGIQLGAK